MNDNQPTHCRLAFASTLHYPNGRNVAHISDRAAQLERYLSVTVAATDSTENETLSVLADLGVFIELVPTGSIGVARRTAIGMAMSHSPDAIFLCDFDRWLHWGDRYPGELAGLPTRISAISPAPWYVCLGRTERAFATHPRTQRDCEAATNCALELAVGYPIDAVGGAAWLAPEGAEIVRANSIECSAATDLEWPALIHRSDPNRLAFAAMEGLEFETATFFAREIAEAGGRAAWINAEYERPEMWAQRLRLAADSVQALVRVRSTHPGDH